MAVAAAELALQLLADVLKTKRGPEVGIGLGPGRATLDFCRTFSSLLAGYSEPVKLKLVAISAGCPADERELEDLVRIAGQKNKHVILIARQCGMCERTRAEALRPLLTNPNLKVFSTLVMDAATAKGLLA